ncbi:hypothetical protein AALP_AAs70921U000200 [Arabis alpina]|uniref:Uncharacterized protein n=1 Tax=Arabis alpina TaxID=50452 RepID=A0A087G0L1_ARAAL|nr:hypothetical protein AALP_AAs70921U000200 [Arabis alpina]
MSNNVRVLSAREKRAVEARTESNARMSQRAGSSMPAPEVGTTATSKSRRPDLEQNVIFATDSQPKPSEKRHEEMRKKDVGVEDGRNHSRESAEGKVTAGNDTVKSRRSKSPWRDGTFGKSESERKRLQHEVTDLKNRLDGAAKLQDAGVQQAVEKMKRDMAARYEDGNGQAKRNMKAISGKLRINIIHFAEVQNNIELVRLLKKGEVHDLDAELVTLMKQEAVLLSTTDEFSFQVGELEEILNELSTGANKGRFVDAKATAVAETGGPP